MTTGINPEVPRGLRRRAAEMLGVPENTPRLEAKRAYFRKVRENDFVSPRSLHHAFCVLAGHNESAEFNDEWLVEEESRLRAEVDSFADKFFTFLAAERRERWEALHSRCENVSPSLAARLQALKAGFAVEVKPLPSDQPYQSLFIEQLLQSFPLAPLAQAASRQAFLREIEEPTGGNLAQWEKAARYLLAEWPALAALDQELVQHIAKLRSRLKRQSKMYQRNQRQRRRNPAGVVLNVKGWWPLWLLVGAVIGIVKIIPQAPNHSLQSAAPPSSNWDLYQEMGLQELFDPSKYDVEVQGDEGFRNFRFTPRTGLTNGGVTGGRQANNRQPQVYDEVSLKVFGVSKEQINVLVSRAVAKRHDSASKKSSEQGDKTRP
jgi:hypothetical protein